jgi:hypothetical protein
VGIGPLLEALLEDGLGIRGTTLLARDALGSSQPI